MSLQNIVLDHTKNIDLFDGVAKKTAELVAKEKGTKSNQMRNFYEYVLKWYEKSRDQRYSGEDGKENFKMEILPFIKMLNSKVVYARNRSTPLVNEYFKDMIVGCVAQIKEQKDLENFKLFFEAVLGFSQEYKN